jgi:hypothetical protein
MAAWASWTPAVASNQPPHLLSVGAEAPERDAARTAEGACLAGRQGKRDGDFRVHVGTKRTMAFGLAVGCRNRRSRTESAQGEQGLRYTRR